MIFNNGDILVISSDITIKRKSIDSFDYFIESGKYKVVGIHGGFLYPDPVYDIKCESGRGVFSISESECIKNNVVTINQWRESILDKLLIKY